MAKRNATEQLDDAVEALMTKPVRPLPSVDPRLAALLEIAGDLRDLPSGAFKARLRTQLLSEASRAGDRAAAAPNYGKALKTVADYHARMAELEREPQLAAFDLDTALRDLPNRAMRFLAPLNQCTLGVSRFSGKPHWECHSGGDEMLHILEGEADVVTLTDAGPVHSAVRAGSIFICPQGLWHKVLPRSGPLSLFYATPGKGTRASNAKDPRPKRRTTCRRGAARQNPPALIAHHLDSALSGLPKLEITSSTTAEEADAAFRPITALGPCTVGVMRFSGLTPWERHPDGDELLHVLEGEVDVTVLTDHGPAQVSVGAGSFFVCPRGLWHRQLPRPSVTVLFGTPTETTQVSFADDPRVG
jgi:quercetin dioxygenase-like cupin family protein